MQTQRVWDIPVRLFHWLLVALVCFSWWSAENRLMDYHRYSGYAVLFLLVFRIYWGILGSSTARFAQFVKGPGAVIGYLKNGKANALGHNPLGALSIVVLLLLLIAQVALGLFAVDVDGLESGPLSYMVSFDTGRLCAKVHETVFDTLMIVVVLHVLAVFFYLIVKRENLLLPMITGRKKTLDNANSMQSAPLWAAILGLVIAAGVVWLIV